MNKALLRTALWSHKERTTALERPVVIKALTALVGRLSISIGWENGPELVHKTL